MPRIGDHDNIELLQSMWNEADSNRMILVKVFSVTESAMIQPASHSQPLSGLTEEFAQRLPDGAVSVELIGGDLVLRASGSLQKRFEELLERHKAGTLNQDEDGEYEAICQLDHALSWLNRLARTPRQG